MGCKVLKDGFSAGKKRCIFSKQFKEDAVRLVKKSAESLAVSPETEELVSNRFATGFAGRRPMPVVARPRPRPLRSEQKSGNCGANCGM